MQLPGKINNIVWLKKQDTSEKSSEPASFITLDRLGISKLTKINKENNSNDREYSQLKVANFMRYYFKRCNSTFVKTSFNRPSFMSSDTARSSIGISLKDEYLNSDEYLAKINEELNQWLGKLKLKGHTFIDFTKSKLAEFKDG